MFSNKFKHPTLFNTVLKLKTNVFLYVLFKIFYSVFSLESNYVLRKMNQITCNITHNTLFNIFFIFV